MDRYLTKLSDMPTLRDLPRGQTATIVEVVGDDALAVRLMEMGLLDGEAVTLLGAAPLGDPLEFELRGYRLSLRKTEAARVEITDVRPGAVG
jgi:ferrous iron transport protein A